MNSIPLIDQVKSPWITPLDLLRQWWCKPAIGNKKLLEKIELACQILHDPEDNIYEATLLHLAVLLPQMNQPAAKYLKTLRFDQKTLKWLNTPLGKEENVWGERAFATMLDTFAAYTRRHTNLPVDEAVSAEQLALSVQQICHEKFPREGFSSAPEERKKSYQTAEDLRLYLRPFLRKHPHSPPLRPPYDHLPPKPVQEGPNFEPALAGHPGSSDLLTLCISPVDAESLYRSAALLLEQKIQPKKTHDLGEDPWLKKMAAYLPLRFAPRGEGEEEVWEDLQKTVTFLTGVQGPFAFAPLPPFPTYRHEVMAPFFTLAREIESFAHILPMEAKYREKLFPITTQLSQILMSMESLFFVKDELALSEAHFNHLHLKNGQLCEASLKIHLLFKPALREKAFERVGNRPRLYDHHLERLYQAQKGPLTLSPEEEATLGQWADFAQWTRYTEGPKLNMDDVFKLKEISIKVLLQCQSI